MRRFALALIFAAILVSGPACAQVNGVVADDRKGVVLFGSPAGASCKAATTGAVRYNSTTPAIEFCNGTAWTALYQVQSTPAITAPAGSGYFVLTKTTYNGNLGGRTGADAQCLTDLTTNTGWQGYSTANSNGQLVSGKVHAFLCDNAVCTNVMPLTKYYIANAGNAAAGGASFTTDSSAIGPGDANDWSAANYFSGTYDWWTMRATNTATQWATWSGPGLSCNNWSDSANSDTGDAANTANTDGFRWYGASTRKTCDTTQHLLCFVNP